MSEREDLVLAYRILAAHGVVDAYGHASLRTAKNPDRYLLARAMAPELVTADDILEFDLDSNPVKDEKAALYLERYIHGEVFKRRPDINAVATRLRSSRSASPRCRCGRCSTPEHSSARACRLSRSGISRTA